MKEQLEQMLADALDAEGMPYKREGVRIRYGGEAGKGVYDFEIDKRYAVECKQIEKLSNLTLPGINKKTHREVIYPKVKGHQVRALREFKGIGGLLILESSTERLFWLPMDAYEAIVIKHRPRTLNKLIDDYQINLDDLIKTIKEK